MPQPTTNYTQTPLTIVGKPTLLSLAVVTTSTVASLTTAIVTVSLLNSNDLVNDLTGFCIASKTINSYNKRVIKLIKRQIVHLKNQKPPQIYIQEIAMNALVNKKV